MGIGIRRGALVVCAVSLSGLLTAAACGSCSPPWVGADRADVSYLVFNPDGTTTNLDVEILDSERAEKIAEAISEQAPERTDCGYSGKLYLQKEGVTVFDEPADINLHPDCAHIVFVIEGETYQRTLVGEGLEMLRSLYAENVPKGKRVAY